MRFIQLSEDKWGPASQSVHIPRAYAIPLLCHASRHFMQTLTVPLSICMRCAD